MNLQYASLLCVFAIGSAACSQDVNFAQIEDPAAAGGEEEEDVFVDTGTPTEDTGDFVEDEDEPAPPPEDDEPELDPPDEDDCENTSDLVYVIDKDSESLYLFEPETLTLDKLGTLDCDYWSSPASMAVARDGVAYVRYSDDAVYAVDVETLHCTQTSYRDSSTNFGSFGMGYATDDADTWRDSLYLSNENRLARLDTASWSLDILGALSSQSELTGNAEGELWAFLPLESPAELVQLDKETGQKLETLNMHNFPDPTTIDTFAFATWGGDFWLFVRTSGMGSSTDVYQVTPQGHMTKVAPNIGINVVGAGVSTCAPTE